MAGGWSRRPTEFALKVKSDHRDVVQKMAMDVLRGVVMASPVDTGRFRGNWLAGTGSAPTESSENVDPSGGGTISKGAAVIAGAPDTPRIWIVNNLPYAERLENGWSQQAPSGMVGVTVARVGKSFR